MRRARQKRPPTIETCTHPQRAREYQLSDDTTPCRVRCNRCGAFLLALEEPRARCTQFDCIAPVVMWLARVPGGTVMPYCRAHADVRLADGGGHWHRGEPPAA